ncbi:nascent polypeptide-associated complex subunit alpha, muscle-specific form-like isoform X3 [Cygnus olor]|uniref:nascent polypeptide-associated complex subunit alpha, muscle-specific form-like isoform X3 n=1 Tax=Cygnus olor TaxID=8869 RepID=UPI001ADE7A84|nr:nascent polypeptide-associated complex subunit alpha, muscle-specific form-like isoform X3 [Cygnus olor]
MAARGWSAVGMEPPLAGLPNEPPHSPATMAERFPRRLPPVPQMPNSPFVVPAEPPTVAAWLLPSFPGAMAVPLQPPQVPTLPYALPQATVWHVVPGVQGQVLQLPAVVQLPPGGHLPPEGHHLQLVQLPTVGHNLQLVQLPAVGHNLQVVQLPHTAPPCAPVCQWGQPMVTGTLVPHHALGLGPRAVLHGEPLHPAGTCLLQAPAHRSPPPPLVPGPRLRGQALPTPRTVTSSQGQLPEPCDHAVGLSKDQGPPLPHPTPPEPFLAPSTCSTQTATPHAATAPEVPEEPPQLPELGPDAFAEAFPELAGDSQQLQHVHDQLLADLDIPGMEELLSWLEAVEPQDAFPGVPSSPALSRFLSQLPDPSEDIEEPSTQGLEATGALGEVPSAPGVYPEKVGGGLSVQSPVVPAVSPPLSSAASPLPSARRRPLPNPPLSPPKRSPDTQVLSSLSRPLPKPPQSSLKSHPNSKVLSDQRRPLPKCPLGPLKSPLAAPASTGTKRGAKRPAPTSTPGTAESSQHKRPTTEKPPGKERKMLLGQGVEGPKTPCQGRRARDAGMSKAPGRRGSSRQEGSGTQQPATNNSRARSKRARSPGAAGGQGAASPPPRRARLLPETPSGEPRAVRPQDRLCPQAVRAKTLQRQHLGTKTPSETLQPLGARAKALGPVRQLPCAQPQPTSGGPSSMPRAPPTVPGSSAAPAAPRSPAGGKEKVVPAPPGSTASTGDAALEQAPRAPCLPAAGGQAQRGALPAQPRTLQPPARPRVDYVPCVGPWAGSHAAPTPLAEQEASVPITPQQRPERERLKKLAQEERQRAAQQMKIGPAQFFAQRQKDRAIAKYYGYP